MAPRASAAGLNGAPLRITWIGDSLAAGLGCDDVADTPAHLSARLLERPVDVTVLAVPGSKASDVIADQLDHVDPYTDLVVLCVGANDVADLSGPRRLRRPGQPHPHDARADSRRDAHAARHLHGRPDGRAAPQPRRRPRSLLRGRPGQGGRSSRPRRVGRHRQSSRRASPAEPAAACSAPIASTPAPRATGCGPNASPPPAASSSSRSNPRSTPASSPVQRRSAPRVGQGDQLDRGR